MKREQQQHLRRARRVRRVRAKMHGTAVRPRVTVMRSNQHIYLQAINDDLGTTIASSSDVQTKVKGTKTERSVAAGQDLAGKLKAAKVNQVTFDRGAYKYHGRVKAVAEALRTEGIEV
jgi:large subunit ribosomal protein L18